LASLGSQPVLLLIIGLWISVCGGALIGLLAVRATNVVPLTHQP
jgi:hypothetical protein